MMDTGTLRWKFDISAFRLIGRDLITDRVTALFELVKNCYDANANVVSVHFNNVSPDSKGVSSIVIEDDGYGMSFEDVRDKWMVIGTSSKRRNKISPSPYSRRCVGEKGIGRFAVDKLGDYITIKTKKKGEKQWLVVTIDWTKYEDQAMLEGAQDLLFTDVDNNFQYLLCDDDSISGTQITISHIREAWTKSDVERFLRESSRITSPYYPQIYPFLIQVYADEYGIDNETDRCLNIGEDKLATLSGHLSFTDAYQESFLFDEKSEQLVVQRVPLKSFGGIKMSLFYFDGNARKVYGRTYRYSHIDGIKIYRDGLITTPFAEAEADVDKQRDILGIEKNRWQDLFYKVSTREIIGFVEITKDGNPKIIDATNRQDFVDTPEYRELKNFILVQLDSISQYKRYLKKKEQNESSRRMEDVSVGVNEFVSEIDAAIKQQPQLGKVLSPLYIKATKVEGKLRKLQKAQSKEQIEFKRKENMYLSIMSMQEYAIQVTHAVRTSLARIERMALYFFEFFPNSEDEELFKEYAKDIYEEMNTLNRVVDYMLSYSQSNLAFEDFDSKTLFDSIVSGYKLKLASKGIKLECQFTNNLMIKCNKLFIKDILLNIIDNSIKALANTKLKIIKCTSFIERNNLVIEVSDTGIGIPKEKWDWVFGLYNTTTENMGGAGVGLYIVKSRVQALKGNVKVVDSEFGNIGTTIRIELPFKNKK